MDDVTMVDRSKHSNVITIGYLNQYKMFMLDTYRAHFDMVVTDDGPLAPVNYILDWMKSDSENPEELIYYL